MKVVYHDLSGRTVLVTGGASGLGFSIAREFVANKSNVVIVGRNTEKLERAKSELEEKVTCFAFDLNDLHGVANLVRDINEQAGNIDVIVNCAGIHLKKEALAVSIQEYENVIRTNQTAVFALTREAAGTMLSRGSGSVIMISSMASQYGIPNVVAYAASKAAVEGMTRALAVEWSPRGVRVNCIAPGFIKTTMSSKALDNDPERREKVLSRTPMGKLGEPSDIANAAIFLASERSKYITGVVLPVDGGYSIGF